MKRTYSPRMQNLNIRSAHLPYEVQEQESFLPLPAGSMASKFPIKRKPVPDRNDAERREIFPFQKKKHDSKIAVRGRGILESIDLKVEDLIPPPLFSQSRNKRNSVGVRAEKRSERRPHPDLQERAQGVYELLSSFHRQVMEDVEEDVEGEEEDLAATSAAADFWTEDSNAVHREEPFVCDPANLEPNFAQVIVKGHSDKMTRERKTVSDSRFSELSGERARKDSVVGGSRKFRGWSSPEESHPGPRQQQARKVAKQSHSSRSERWWEFE